MNVFTFAVLIYNQEKILVETLESIKFQIIRFGSDKKINLIITNDGSRDRSSIVINKWTKENETIFNSIEIIDNKTNKGTVYNYNIIMSKIHDEPFKIIAGDDLIGPVNIFNTISSVKADIDTFPFYRLEGKAVGYKDDYLYSYFWKMKKYTPKRNVRYMQDGDFLHTPSTFYSKDLYLQSDAKKFNTNFVLFEDDPTFYSMFKYCKNVFVRFHKSPIILYRYSENATSTIPNYTFINDWKRLQVEYIDDSKGLRKLKFIMRSKTNFKHRLNLFKIFSKLDIVKKKLIVNMFYKKEYNEFKKVYKENIEIFKKYYLKMKECNEQFLKSMNIEL